MPIVSILTMKHYFLNLTDTFSINYVVRSHTDVLFVPNSSCWLSVFLFGLDLEQLVYSLKNMAKWTRLDIIFKVSPRRTDTTDSPNSVYKFQKVCFLKAKFPHVHI